MEEEIDFKFTSQEVDVITNALAHRPYGEVYNIMAKILERMNPPIVKDQFTPGLTLDDLGAAQPSR